MRKQPTLLSYRLRISLTMAFFTLIPCLFLGIIHFQSEMSRLEQTAFSQYTQMLEVNKEQIDRELQELENKVLYVKSNAGIRTALNKLQQLSLVEKLDFVFALREAENGINTDDQTLSLRYYSDNSDFVYGGYCYTIQDLQNAYAERQEDLTRIVNLGNNETIMLVSRSSGEKNQPMVSAYTKINNSKGTDHILEISVPVESMVFHVESAMQGRYCIGTWLQLDGEPQTVLLRGDASCDHKALDSYFQKGEDAGYYPISTSLSKYPESKLACLLHENYARSLMWDTSMTLIGVFALLISMVILCSYITSRLLTKRVIHFIERVDYELGDTTASKEDTEILDKDFLDIEQRVRELVRCSREYGKQLEDYALEKNKMELELLQMRFNPHFLYNTLGSIRYQVKEERIRKTIDSLISYYRIVLSKGSLLISIETELQMCKNYLDLEIFAFDLKNVSYAFEIDEDVKQYTIIKHLLQPIVENALEHGIRGKNGGASVTIRAYLQDDNIVLEVEDTGVGMTQEQIDTVTTKPCGGFDGRGYGVFNVIQRIKTYYGPQYGVEYSSQIGKGTLVRVMLSPKMEQNREQTVF